jgi:hypothetical protein
VPIYVLFSVLAEALLLLMVEKRAICKNKEKISVAEGFDGEFF